MRELLTHVPAGLKSELPASSTHAIAKVLSKFSQKCKSCPVATNFD